MLSRSAAARRRREEEEDGGWGEGLFEANIVN